LSATIYDIAQKAGVSIATVSRVFNDNTSVSKKNREKVLKIADEMGYYPQGYASGLAGKKNNLITAIVPILSNYFFMEVLAGIQDQIVEHNFDLNIYNVTSRGGNMLEQVEHVFKKRMSDGYLMISIHMEEQKWAQLNKYKLPITLIDEYYAEYDSVSVDSVEGAYKATNKLIEDGHKKIAFISALEGSKPIRQRTEGYMKALDEHGLPFNKKLITRADLNNRDGFTEKGGYLSMKKLLKMDARPDACLCASDIQALGALKALSDAGEWMPMISFDDIEISEYLGLSTMRQPMYDMGYMATQKVINRIKNKNHTVSHTVFSPELVLRSTTEKKQLRKNILT